MEIKTAVEIRDLIDAELVKPVKIGFSRKYGPWWHAEFIDTQGNIVRKESYTSRFIGLETILPIINVVIVTWDLLKRKYERYPGMHVVVFPSDIVLSMMKSYHNDADETKDI